MVDERDFDGLLREIYRAMGRVEAGQDTLTAKIEEVQRDAKDSIRERDAKFSEQSTKLDVLTERQKEDAFKLANVQQLMVTQVAGVRTEVMAVGAKVDGQEVRLGALEAPIRKAVAARLERRQSLAKIVMIASSVSGLIWLLVEPVWKIFADMLLHRMMSGGGTP